MFIAIPNPTVGTVTWVWQPDEEPPSPEEHEEPERLDERTPEAARRVMAKLETLINDPRTPRGEAEAARTQLRVLRSSHPQTYVPLSDIIGNTGGMRERDDAEFRESEHPRAPDGEFTSGGGGGGRARLEPTKTVSGKRLTAAGDPLPAHIAKLAIPPAWTDVHFAAHEGASLLVVGKDTKGRRTAIYSASHASAAAATKYARVKELAAKIGKIKQQNDKARRDPATREAADCLALVIALGIRPGSESRRGGAVRAYGATTLEGRHVRVSSGGRVRLQFTGKKGVALNLSVADASLAQMLLRRKEKAGPSGQLFDVSDHALRDHADSMDGGGFHPKDFRTHLGTTTAAKLVQQRDRPGSEREYKRAVLEVAAEVAAKLGNTRTVALQSYIAPEVFSEWRAFAGAAT